MDEPRSKAVRVGSATRLSLLTVVVTSALFVVTTAALAASSQREPARLVLAKSDFPAAATEYKVRPAPGYLKVTGVKGAESQAVVPAGGSVNGFPKAWRMESRVFVAADGSSARKFFALGRVSNGVGDGPDGDAARVTLRSYGDEQVAAVSATGFVRTAIAFVRKGTVVWEITVRTIQWPVTKAQLLTQLNIYAVKQQRRVGNG